MADQRVEKYKQLVANGVDPVRAKTLLQKSMQQNQSTQQPSFLQKSGDFGVGVAQGVSDVGQRTVGRVVGGIAEKIGTKLQDTGLARGIQSGARKLFGDKAVSDFQREEQKAMQDPNYNIAASNIMSERQQESGAGKFGRGVGQFIGTTALTAPIGGIVGAGGKALFGQAVTKLGGFGVGALQGGVTGAIGTRIGTRAMADRGATAGETLGGAALGGVIGGALGAKAVSKSNKLVKMITEKGTSKNIEKAAEQGRIKFTQGLLSKEGKITPTERIGNARNIIAKEVKSVSTKNPQKLVQQIDNLGRQRYEGLSNELKNIKVGTMTKAKGAIKSQIKEVAGLTDERTKADIKKISNLSKQIDGAKTADDLWKIRTTWDKLFSASQKQAHAGSAPTTRKANTLWQSVRGTMNDNLDDIVKTQGSEGVKGRFYDMSSLLEAKDNLIKNIPDLAKKTSTKLGQLTKGAIAGGLGIGALNYLGKRLKGE